MFTIIGGDGKEYGPATVDQIRAWITAGRANLDTKAKALGSDEWRRLGDYAEFAPPDAAPPVMSPPLPPPQPAIPGAVVVPVSTADLADRGMRFLAALVDGILKLLAWLPTSLAIWHAVSSQIMSGQQPSILTIMNAMNGVIVRSLPFLAALVLLQAILLSMRGQSVGKLVTGLRIVRHRDGGQAGFLHAFLLRGTVPWIIEQIPLFGGLFWLVDVCFIFGDERRCLHDLIAGTKVVKA